jgi:hypothetical protein
MKYEGRGRWRMVNFNHPATSQGYTGYIESVHANNHGKHGVMQLSRNLAAFSSQSNPEIAGFSFYRK